MDDLIAFLKARFEEDERIALATLDVNVRAGLQLGRPVPRWEFRADGEIRDADDVLRVKFTWAQEADHIVRHDPARVLREVEAKRRIVATYTEVDAHPNRLVYGFMQQQWVALRAVIAGLALPYSDHLDYREEWKP